MSNECYFGIASVPDIATISPLNPHPRYIGPSTASKYMSFAKRFAAETEPEETALHPQKKTE